MARGGFYKLTPLHLAARHNKDTAVTQALIAAGADPNAQDDYGYTPLHWAASDNDNPAVDAGPYYGRC